MNTRFIQVLLAAMLILSTTFSFAESEVRIEGHHNSPGITSGTRTFILESEKMSPKTSTSVYINSPKVIL